MSYEVSIVSYRFLAVKREVKLRLKSPIAMVNMRVRRHMIGEEGAKKAVDSARALVSQPLHLCLYRLSC